MFLTNAQRWNLNVLNMFFNRLDVITMFFETIECSYNVPIGHILEAFWKHVWKQFKCYQQLLLRGMMEAEEQRSH